MDIGYVKYIEERTKGNIKAATEAEKEAAFVMREYHAKSDFCLVFIAESQISWYRCSVHELNGAFKFNISDVRNYTCRIEDAFSDSSRVQSKLNELFSFIPKMSDENVYVKGKYSDNPVLQKILSGNGKSLTVLASHAEANLKGLAYIPKNLLEKRVNINVKDCCIGNFLTEYSKRLITIPLHKATLDSDFVEGVKWADILPVNKKVTPDAVISGVDVMLVHIYFYIDAYSNIFCTISNVKGQKHTTLIYNNFSDKINKVPVGCDKPKGNRPADDIRPEDVKPPKSTVEHIVIDTNVFLDCPDIISHIDKASKVVLAAKVIDELDNHKINPVTKENANAAIASIERHSNRNPDRLVFEKSHKDLLGYDWNLRSADNLIFSVALGVKEEYNLEKVKILTSDKGLKLKSMFEEGLDAMSLYEFNKDLVPQRKKIK